MSALAYAGRVVSVFRRKCLGLKLRPEYQAKEFGPTHVDLSNEAATGASQLPATDFLDISYPCCAVTRSLDALAPGGGRVVVLKGPEGSGKSHALGVLHHCLGTPETGAAWLSRWADLLERPELGEIELRRPAQILSESLDSSKYELLWDYLLNWHLRGEWGRKQWEGRRRLPYQVPDREIFEQMFTEKPTVLLLDGFERWFDGLTETDDAPLRSAAWGTIQILGELATERPDILALVVSVQDERSEMYRRLEFLEPVVVDLDDQRARRDRDAWTVHRLFENRRSISDGAIRARIERFVTARFDADSTPTTERPARWREFIEAWPFTPGFVEMLEDRLSVDDARKARRVVFKLLADLFEQVPRQRQIITPADVGIGDEVHGIAAWLAAAVSERDASLRDAALENLHRVLETGRRQSRTFPHAEAIMSSLWVRSMPASAANGTSEKHARLPDARSTTVPGVDLATLRLDVSRGEPIDADRFAIEVDDMIDLCLNLHRRGDRLLLSDKPNPRSRLSIEAQDDSHFRDRSDERELANQIRYVIGTREDVSGSFRLVVLGRNWAVSPWSDVDEEQRPPFWDGRIVLLVIPEDPGRNVVRLARWLKEHVPQRRNTVRFLLPREGSRSVYDDPDLLVPVRGMVLADRWETEDPEYLHWHQEFQSRVRQLIGKRFDRFAVLHTWNESEPEMSELHVVKHDASGAQIPDAVDAYIRQNLVKPGSFEEMLVELARDKKSVARLLSAAQEPRENGEINIPWVGREATLLKLGELCARGRVEIELPEDGPEPELPRPAPDRKRGKPEK